MTRNELFAVLASIATHVCYSYAGDLFWDLNDILTQFESGEEIIILSRTTGSDPIGRFRFNGNENESECIRNCEKSLGWDVMTRILPNDNKVIVKWNDRGNERFSKRDFEIFTGHLYCNPVIL